MHTYRFFEVGNPEVIGVGKGTSAAFAAGIAARTLGLVNKFTLLAQLNDAWEVVAYWDMNGNSYPIEATPHGAFKKGQ
jgi:hypothetical protein